MSTLYVVCSVHTHGIELAVNRKKRSLPDMIQCTNDYCRPNIHTHTVSPYQFTFLRGFKLDQICASIVVHAYCLQFVGASESPHSINIDEVKEIYCLVCKNSSDFFVSFCFICEWVNELVSFFFRPVEFSRSQVHMYTLRICLILGFCFVSVRVHFI